MTNKKFTYSKMTFILSIIGFIGSIGFYLGVLKQVYATPDNIQVKVSELERENNQLKTQITVLTKMVDECQDK
jgi:cell division protein FtsB